jgi:hypothetical protein
MRLIRFREPLGEQEIKSMLSVGVISPSSAAGVLIAAQVVSIVVLKKSSFVLAGATN